MSNIEALLGAWKYKRGGAAFANDTPQKCRAANAVTPRLHGWFKLPFSALPVLVMSRDNRRRLASLPGVAAKAAPCHRLLWLRPVPGYATVADRLRHAKSPIP